MVFMAVLRSGFDGGAINFNHGRLNVRDINPFPFCGCGHTQATQPIASIFLPVLAICRCKSARLTANIPDCMELGKTKQ